ncbi:hypothetical protein [uncultured Aquimarina sp.]|uniref:nuclear transport factor 2 family protein n=1 Tax=uncultured Aquimarina sp. TaxID=575652 RepID=UPI00261352E7|nr:hypothetical protein [uncultured Aquimarina sp.]
MKRISILIITFLSTTTILLAQDNDSQIAEKAFNGWHKGENSGNYDVVKSLITDAFVTFEHPFTGRAKDQKAKATIEGMISQREKSPNNLSFSEVTHTPAGNDHYFHFRSTGEVMGKFQYDGYNIIIITVENGKITGFKEYLGLIDPAWFQG